MEFDLGSPTNYTSINESKSVKIPIFLNDFFN